MNKILSIFSIHTFILVILGSSLVVRFFFAALPPFKSDMESFLAWSNYVFRVGFSEFYSGQIWTDYAPGYFYFLWLKAFLKHSFFSHSSYATVLFLYKFFPMLCDILTGFLIYLTILALSSNRDRKHIVFAALLALLYLFNPVIILDSSIWGQVDSVFTFFLALSFYLLTHNRAMLAVVPYVFACLIKPQAGLVAPAYLLFFLTGFNLRKIFFAFFVGIFSFFLFAFPFFGFTSITSFASLMSSSVNTYPYGSINMFNLWGIFGFWKSDTTPFFFNMTQQQLGLGLFVLLVFTGGIYTFFRIRSATHIVRLLFFTAYCAYMILVGTMVLTRMHERYLFPFFLYLLFFIGLYFLVVDSSSLFSRNVWRISFFIHHIFYIILSFIHFLNLYYVYIYYYYFLYFNSGVPADHVFFHSLAQSLEIWSFIQLFVALLFIVVLFYTTYRIQQRISYVAVSQ